LRRRIVALGIAGTLAAALSLVLHDHLCPVIWLDDVPLSSLADKAVLPAITEWWTHFKSNTVRLSVPSAVFEAKAGEIGCELDSAETLRAALRAKKSRLHWVASGHRVAVDPVISCVQSGVNRAIDTWQQQGVQQPPKPATLAWERGAIVPHPGTAGDVVDRARVKQLLEQQFVRLVREGLALPLTRVEPRPDADQLKALAEQATRYIKSSVVLESKQPPLKAHLLRSDLGRLVRLRETEPGRFEVAFDAEELAQVLRSRRVAPEWRAKNASLEPAGNGKFTVVPEMRGYRFSVPKLADQLVQSLQQGQTRVTIDVELGEDAKIKSADVEKLGIRELIGSFTTRHACCQPRVNNIHRIADLLDGTIVLPGETFSVNDTIGPRSITNGFLMAPSIEDGEMVDAIGGGVSQFATTFYNALLRSGLEILERRAHTYWFDRYPMGHEATLAFPKPDLVFRNDTHAGVLIKTEYTDKTITVRLYGDKEGRQVAFGVSKMMEIEQPAIERLPNPEIRPDKEHTKNGGRMGWSVVTWRTVTLANGEKKKDERKVTYKPQVRRVEVHPCRLRSDELGYTGEKCPKVEPEEEEAGQEQASSN
jgi:vancomycin resistance protein YoaR